MKLNTRHTEETKRKMSLTQKQRYANESQEKRQQRIDNIKKFYSEAQRLMKEEHENDMRKAHIEWVKGEYENLKTNGLIN